MNLLELMRSRRSVRTFKPEKPPDGIIDELIKAAISAPSASNKQPWRFFIVSDRETIESAARAVQQASAHISSRLQPEFREVFEEYAVNFSAFSNAPVVIVPCFRTFSILSNTLVEDAGEELRMHILGLERDASLLSVSMATQNILLMAHDLGLGACCMTGAILAEDRISSLLKVPDGWHMPALIAVGYPDESPEDPGRKPFESFIKRS